MVSASHVFFFSSRRRHTRWPGDWSSDVCSSDLLGGHVPEVRFVERYMAKHDRKVPGRFEVQSVQDVHEEGDGRSIFLRARGTDDLDTGLVELGALAAAHARPAVDRQDVGELVGWWEIPEALGDEPGYRRRHLRAKHNHLVVWVEELK